MSKRLKQYLKAAHAGYKVLRDYYHRRIYRQVWMDVRSEIDNQIWIEYGAPENSIIYADVPEMSPFSGPIKEAHVELDPVFKQVGHIQTQLKFQIMNDGHNFQRFLGYEIYTPTKNR